MSVRTASSVIISVVVGVAMTVDWVVVKLPVAVEFENGEADEGLILTHVPATSALKHDLYESRLMPGDRWWSSSWDVDHPETLPVDQLVDIDSSETVVFVDVSY